MANSFFNSSNPVLVPITVPHSGGRTGTGGGGGGSPLSPGLGEMTIQGTVNKTFILLGLAVLTASFTWNMALTNPSSVMIWTIGGSIGALVMALITTFKKEWSPASAPAYALLEGTALGAISALFEQMYGGIVIQAVFLTFATLMGMLLAYTSGLIKVTDKFRSIMTVAVMAIGGLYLVDMVLRMFKMSIPFISGGGPLGIGFSVLVVGIAAFSLLMDFDLIKQAAQMRMPKYMEWYSSFGLMVTLVWLYLEILKLLMKLQRREN